MINPAPYDCPFPAALTVIDDGFPETLFCPKAWGTDLSCVGPSALVSSSVVNFSGAGVVEDDPLKVLETSASISFEEDVDYADQVDLYIAQAPALAFNSGVFKVGLGNPASVEEIAQLIGERGLYAYTIKFGACYTDAPEEAFDPGIVNSDIYCIGAIT